MSPHPDDLTGMKDDMTAFIEGLGMRRFFGYVECEEVPIRPLIDALSFIQDKQRWGYMFRLGLFEIPPEDFELIQSRMIRCA